MSSELPIHSSVILNARQIVTHPNRVHRDEFLAVSILASVCHVPIFRRRPYTKDLADPHTLVIDSGMALDASKGNFDHHQLNSDACVCALSLVLQELGYYQAALAIWPWLGLTEVQDTHGVKVASESLRVSTDAFMAMLSPVEAALMQLFSTVKVLHPGGVLYKQMELIGTVLTRQLHLFCLDLDTFKRQSVVLTADDKRMLKSSMPHDMRRDARRITGFLRSGQIDHDVLALLDASSSSPRWVLYAPLRSKVSLLKSRAPAIKIKRTLDAAGTVAITSDLSSDDDLRAVLVS